MRSGSILISVASGILIGSLFSGSVSSSRVQHTWLFNIVRKKYLRQFEEHKRTKPTTRCWHAKKPKKQRRGFCAGAVMQ